jgi:putative iron-dependent peroxidase
MRTPQTGILLPLPRHGRYLTLSHIPGRNPRAALAQLAKLVDGERVVAGLGHTLVTALGAEVPGLRPFPALAAPGLAIPATPHDLWLWLRGNEPGELFLAGTQLLAVLSEAFTLDGTLDAFTHQSGRDLTGYEDGTENPQGEDAYAAALAADGSSFVAVQRWQHDFARFQTLSPTEQDASIGRRRADNEELEDAPESAHVKRTAQEDFEPEAFVVRRSMAWVDGTQGGLQFVAFGHSLDAFEAQLRRMAGLDDGIQDALFRFTRPLDGAYYWCPPIQDGRLDLSALGF